MAQYIRLLREDKEGTGASRHVFRVQIRGGIPLQGEIKTEEEANGE